MVETEWIITNGIGGFASSTTCGANTRRYHGLLVAAFDPPTGRHVLVSKVEEKVTDEQGEYALSTNTWPDAIHPEGYRHLVAFERMPVPKSVFHFGPHRLIKRVWMHYGYNTTVVEYTHTGSTPCTLQLTPLFVYRDYHHLFHENDAWRFDVMEYKPQALQIRAALSTQPVYMRYSKGRFEAQRDWYRKFTYAREKERGLDFEEDALAVGTVWCELQPGESATLIFTDTAAELDGDPYRWLEEEHARQTRLGEKWPTGFIRDLVISGDQFLVHRRSSDAYSLIAGYPWFTDWGRDTMMAMRGLIIATGRQEEARSILSTFIRYLSEGMIPNRFPDAGETPEYNTIDATLWLFVAMYEYVEKFGDPGFARQHYDDLGGILEAHIKGTRYNIHVTPEGLLYGGTPGVQLTWMDAKVDGVVVTPREGCAVEINALWYNALSIYAWLGMLLERDVTAITDRIAAFRQTFQQYFFNDLGYLNDVVIPGRVVDDAIRPNMIYAVSLPFSPLTAEQQRQVLDVVTQHLYTPLGLRSLSPGHPDFKPTYDGDQWQRDHAYHQGTVWAFLWGEYCLARLKVFNYSDEACRWVEREVAALEQHFYQDDGLYAISEVFDGVNPGAGKGCIQQAWSVGMLLLVHLNIKKIA